MKNIHSDTGKDSCACIILVYRKTQGLTACKSDEWMLFPKKNWD
jgi:hypothetical protein